MVANDRSDVSLEQRIVDAALRCIARWGIAKTTLDDVAREAGCGRATIYRTFAGGKSAVLHAVLTHEIARCAAAIDGAACDAESLDDMLVSGTLAVTRFLRRHDALTFLLAHEPDAVLPHIAFDKLDDIFAGASLVVAPHLNRFVPPADVEGAAEWVTRVVLSYALNPSDGFDLTKEADATRFVRTYLLPAIAPTIAAPTTASPIQTSRS